MSAYQLLIHRIKKEWQFQWGVIRTVVDWTVVLYVILPLISYAVKVHIDCWSGDFQWFQAIPLSYITALPLVFILRGHVRLFLKEGDQLFLFQCHEWMKRLRSGSLIYSFLTDLVVMGTLFLFLAPVFFLHYGLSPVQILLWMFFCGIGKTMISCFKHLTFLRYRGWKGGFFRWLITLAGGAVYYLVLQMMEGTMLFALTIVVSGLFLYLLGRRIVTRQENFLVEVGREDIIRLRYAAVLLKAGYVYTRKSSVLALKKRPWIFSGSRPLFKERNSVNLLTEACVKGVLRNRSHLLSYGQLTLVSVAAVLVFPLKWKLLLWCILAVVFGKFSEIFWQETQRSNYVRIFPWQPEIMVKGAVKSIFILMMIILTPVSIILGAQVYSWLGAIVLPLAGGLAGMIISRIIGNFS